MKKILTSFLFLVFLILTIRSGSFLFQSLDWSLPYCVDMVLMKFFAWSLDHGVWPYTDIYTYNFPMTIYINWFALKVFGDSSFGFRLFDVTWLIATSGLTFIYIKKKSNLIALIALGLCLTLAENATNFGAFQRETMMLPFWILSLISYDKIRDRNSIKLHGFLLGFYICISALVKPTGFLLLVLILLSLLWEAVSKSNFKFRNTVELYLFTLMGGILVLFLSIIPFILHGTFLASLQNWYSYFKDLSLSLEILSLKELVFHLFAFSPKYWFIPLNEPVLEFQSNGHFSLFHLFIISFYIFLLYQKKVDAGPLFVLISGILNYIIQAKGFAYHLFLFWFGCILVIAYLLHYFYEISMNEKKWKQIFGIFAILLIGITVINQQTRSLKLYKGTGLYNSFNQPKKELPKIQLLDALKELNTGIQEKPAKIQVFEAYHSITLSSIMDEKMNLISKYPEAYIFYNENPVMEKYKIDMLKSLESQKPDIIVLNREGTFRIKKDLFQTFPALKVFLEKYKLQKEIKEINNVTYSIYLLDTNTQD